MAEEKERLIEYKPVEQLVFDPKNPRLPKTLDKSDEQAVIGEMLRDAVLIELMAGIGVNGYFSGEPILVSKRDDGRFNVVEGNRRLAAVKLLRDPELAPYKKKAVLAASEEAEHRPPELPVIIYDGRDEILDYLGYRHITGIKAWGPLAKARYLRDLREEMEESDPRKQFIQLAKAIGSGKRTDHVGRLLTGLSLYDEIADHNFFDIERLDERSIKFSVLTTALSYSKIVTFLGLHSIDPELERLVERHLQELTSWLFEKNAEGKTRLGESRNLKQLSEIVANDRALQAFREGSTLDEAHLLTDAPMGIFERAIYRSKQSIESARGVEHLVTTPTRTDSVRLFEIREIAKSLRRLVEDKLSESDD